MNTEADNKNSDTSKEIMKIRLVFPQPSENDNIIKKEINDILRKALIEQLKNTHGIMHREQPTFPGNERGQI